MLRRGTTQILAAACVAIGATLSLAACGGNDSSTTAAPASGSGSAKTKPEPQSRSKPEPEPQGPTAAQIREAEKVVKAELPSIPIWKGTTFHGVPTADGNVCVERTYSQHTAEVLGGGRNAGFVVVSIPSMMAGEPQDGTCGKPEPTPDERLSPAELEDLAGELTLAIEGGSSSEIIATANRIKNKLDKPLPVMTKQANLIHSATVAAIEGSETGDDSQLEAALRFLAES